jgi:hypothetical protein
MSLAFRLRRADGGAAFGTLSPEEEAETPPNVLDKGVTALANGLGRTAGSVATLPRRAIENSQYSLDSGNYDPRPTMQAATLPLGTGALATLPVKGGMAALPTGLKYSDDLIDAAAQGAQSSSPKKKDAGMSHGGAAMDLAFRLKRASGGAISGLPVTPKTVDKPHVGAIVSAVPGRTDKHKMSVPPGSYVINADTVSHLGENNTMAGLKRLQHLFGPDGPYAPKKTGVKHGRHEAIPVLTAGGEFVIAPEYVRMVGKGNINLGHKILDEFQKRVRLDHIKTLQSLPGPAQT